MSGTISFFSKGGCVVPYKYILIPPTGVTLVQYYIVQIIPITVLYCFLPCLLKKEKNTSNSTFITIVIDSKQQFIILTPAGWNVGFNFKILCFFQQLGMD